MAKKKTTKSKAVAKKKTPIAGWEKEFVEEWLVNGRNITRAYMRVKPHVTWMTARNEGSKCLAKPCVKAYKDQTEKDLIEQAKVSKETLINELLSIAMADITDIVTVQDVPIAEGSATTINTMTVKDLNELPPEIRKTIAALEMTDKGVKVRFHSKADAIKILNSMLGFDNQKTDNSTVTINVQGGSKTKKPDIEEDSERGITINVKPSKE